MWYDTVAHSSQAALRAAVQAVGADRLVLGSDFPYQGGEHYLDTVAYIERAGPRRSGHPGHPGRQRRSASGTGLSIGGLSRPSRDRTAVAE